MLAQVTFEDDEIYPLLERSVRERGAEWIEEMLRYGTLGPLGAGVEKLRDAEAGREILPASFLERAIQRETPVVTESARAHGYYSS